METHNHPCPEGHNTEKKNAFQLCKVRDREEICTHDLVDFHTCKSFVKNYFDKQLYLMIETKSFTFHLKE